MNKTFLAIQFIFLAFVFTDAKAQPTASYNADSAQYWWGKGFVNAVKGNYETAISEYDRSIELYPLKGEVFYDRGNAKAQTKNYMGAIEDFTVAIKYLTDDAEKWKAYFLRGRAKQEISDLQGAILDFTEAIALSPKDEEAYYQRASAKDKLKDFRGAIQDYTKVIEINPSSMRAYKLRGIEKIRIQDKDGGCVDLAKASELGDTKVTEVMGRLCNAPQ